MQDLEIELTGVKLSHPESESLLAMLKALSVYYVLRIFVDYSCDSTGINRMRFIIRRWDSAVSGSTVKVLRGSE